MGAMGTFVYAVLQKAIMGMTPKSRCGLARPSDHRVATTIA